MNADFHLCGNLLCALHYFSCKKKEETVVPEYLSGTMDVTFSPAGSIRSVSLSPQGNSGSVASGNPDATGYLKINYLPAGNYVVTFNPPYGYATPTPRNITIAAKANSALSTKRTPTCRTPCGAMLAGIALYSPLSVMGAAIPRGQCSCSGYRYFL